MQKLFTPSLFYYHLFFFSFFPHSYSFSFLIFSSFFFFFFSFSFLTTQQETGWNNITHAFNRGKDAGISKDASTQCYLGTWKWGIQLVLHLSAARQQQVARGNILFLIVCWLSMTEKSYCIVGHLRKIIQETAVNHIDLLSLEIYFPDLQRHKKIVQRAKLVWLTRTSMKSVNSNGHNHYQLVQCNYKQNCLWSPFLFIRGSCNEHIILRQSGMFQTKLEAFYSLSRFNHDITPLVASFCVNYSSMSWYNLYLRLF